MSNSLADADQIRKKHSNCRNFRVGRLEFSQSNNRKTYTKSRILTEIRSWNLIFLKGSLKADGDEVISRTSFIAENFKDVENSLVAFNLVKVEVSCCLIALQDLSLVSDCRVSTVCILIFSWENYREMMNLQKWKHFVTVQVSMGVSPILMPRYSWIFCLEFWNWKIGFGFVKYAAFDS